MNYKLIITTCIFCHALLEVGCTKTVEPDELLTSADSIIFTHTDSAISILDKVAESTLSDRQEADYWRLQTTLHILQGKSTVEDSMIIFALNYYKKHNMQKELKEAYKLTLNHLAWNNDTLNYNLYMEEASNLAKQINDSLFKYTILRSLANDFYFKNDYKFAYRYYAKATEYNNSYSSTFYMAALAYSWIGNSDTIGYWMQKGLDLAKKQKDSASMRHYYRNYADILIRFKEYDKALANIKNMELYSTDTSFSVAPYMITIIYMQQHQLDSAQFYINMMKKQDFSKKNKRSFVFTSKGLALIQNIIDYAKGGDFNFELIGRYSDSLLFDQNRRIKKFEEQVLIKQKLSEQNQELVIKKQRIQLLLLSIIFIASISIILTYLYIRSKKNKLYQMEEKMESIQKILKDVTVDLEEDRKNSSYFKKVLLQQLGLIRQTASNPTSQNQEMLQRMAKITNDEIPIDSLIIWDDLYALVDSLYDNFYTKVKNTFGNILNEKEIQLCCLLCVNFTTKEVSVVSQQSVRTIYQRKTTIREKLNMLQGEDIVEFLKRSFQPRDDV